MSGLAAPVLGQALVEPQTLSQRFIKAQQEGCYHPVRAMRLKELFEVEKLFDNQVRTELLRGIEYVLGHSARLIRLALGDKHRHEDELSEGTTARPVARSKLNDPLGLASRSAEVAELAQTACRLAGERAFIEAADPWRRFFGRRNRENLLSLEEELRARLSLPESRESPCLHGE